MFDGIFLSKIKKEFEILISGRLTKIIEIGDNDFIFEIRANHNNYNLLASFDTNYSRIHLTNKSYDKITNTKSFTLLLKKYIEGYFIDEIKQYSSDRVLVIKFTGYNEIKDRNSKYLIFEIMGRYSNLIITDSDYRIIDSLKHDGIGEYNRTILPNALYEFPKSDKINPLDLTIDELENELLNIKNPKELMNKFNGISLTLATSIFSYDLTYHVMYDYLNSDIKPVIIEGLNQKLDFYYNPLNYKIIKEFDSLSNLLDEYYYEMDIKSKIKSKTDDLSNFINKQIKKHEAKIIKLEKELSDTSLMDSYKLYGELLLSYPNLKEKKKNVKILNYYDNTEINIILDEKYTIIDNSNKFYKKYQKIKNSIPYINEQINICNNEIEYFNLLKYQLTNSSLNEALEIQDELINNKYLFKNVKQANKKNKIKLLTYIVDNTLISVGKNNIQNEYLTHKFSKSDEYWFHVKDAPGSHVVVHSNELNEELIRSASLLASYYSSQKDSSSVPVDYTKIKYIKKIPGKRNCFVTYTNQKTIYIDPDINLINKMEIKK